jgi:D-3-phosphoglycerate dehydrogenase
VPVNEVNARLLAQERGLRVWETVRIHGENFTSSVTVRVESATGEHSVKGTVFNTDAGGVPRVVSIDRFYLEMHPDGHQLILRNEDRPGVIGAVGTLLGQKGVNVARMQVGLDEKKKEALQVWNVDAALDAATLEAIRKVPGVRTAQIVSL